MKTSIKFFCFLLLLTNSFIALANDSAGTSSAGGITFLKTSGVLIKKEELIISPQNIQVKYLFENMTHHDIVRTIYFPLPPYEMLGANVSWDKEINPSLVPDKEVPFINFSVNVNGQNIQYKTIIRAIYKNKDVTQNLKKSAIPLNPQLVAGNIPVMDSAQITKWQLAAKKLNLLDIHLKPLWQKQIFYEWQQTFPAGKTISIVHNYKPAAGSFYSDRIASLKQSNQNLLLSDMQRMKQLFNMDLNQTVRANKFKEWLNLQIKKSHLPSAKHCYAYQKRQADCVYALFDNVNYILTTGSNWGGPIANFNLIIRFPKETAVTYNKFYKEQKVTTTFESSLIKIHIKDFLPQKELKILFASTNKNS